MTVELFSILGSFGCPQVGPDQGDTIFIDNDRTERFSPPRGLFTTASGIDDELWNFQMKPILEKSAPVYLSILKDAYVLPSGVVMDSSGRLLAESLYPRNPITYQKNNMIEQTPDDDALRSAYLAGTIDPTRLMELDRAVHCRDIGEYGYFHWVTTVMPRASLVLESFPGRTGPFLIHANPAFGAEWLTEVFPEIEVQEAGGRLIHVKELIFPCPSQIGSSHYTRNPVLLKRFLRALDKRGLFEHDTELLPKHIYISRADAPVRRIMNEDLLILDLEKRGFEKLCMSEYTVRKQIALFANAETIVAPHGAGLANLVFSGAKAKIVELMSSTRTWAGFKVLSHIADGQYFAFVSDQIVPEQTSARGRGNEDFNVDVIACLRFIDSCTLDAV